MNIFHFPLVTVDSNFLFRELWWMLLAFMYELRIQLGNSWNSGCRRMGDYVTLLYLYIYNL